MSTQFDPSTAAPVHVNVIWDDNRIEAIKTTIDSCIDAGEGISNDAAKAASTKFFPVIIDYACSLLGRFGFMVNSKDYSKPIAEVLAAKCNPVIDNVSKTSNAVAKASLHKSVDVSTQASNTLAGYFFSWFRRES